MSLRASRTSTTNRSLSRRPENSKETTSHRAWHNPELQAVASMYISDFLGRVSTSDFPSNHPDHARRHHRHRNPNYYPASAVPAQNSAKGPPHRTKRFHGNGGNMALVHDEYGRSGYTVSTNAKMEPLRLGLRHLVQQYQETREVCNKLKTEFDDQVRSIKAYCDTATLDKLWKDKSRSKRDSRQGLDAKLCTVEYCLDNFESYLLQVHLPVQADDQIDRIRESGRRIVGLMREARRSRIALHRLVAELSQGEIEANPNSEENKAIFNEQGDSGDNGVQDLNQDNVDNGDDSQPAFQ
ncbi:hypothetical protein ACRALDRAFT_1064773 [Sodiomyces alcalophilus JCM 7366]|uniref:uncharacterized protein n=1 Tax=Sodiomyces alcalophilus JCM 7366 TaxID=591952 RepID=UPI0039B4CFD1